MLWGKPCSFIGSFLIMARLTSNATALILLLSYYISLAHSIGKLLFHESWCIHLFPLWSMHVLQNIKYNFLSEVCQEFSYRVPELSNKGVRMWLARYCNCRKTQRTESFTWWESSTVVFNLFPCTAHFCKFWKSIISHRPLTFDQKSPPSLIHLDPESKYIT